MLKTSIGAILFRLHMTLRAILSPAVFGVAGAVFDAQGRVLLVRQSYMRGWRLPGGGVDRGELPGLAVLRELEEEVGLRGGTAQFFGLYTRRAGWATNIVALYRVTDATIAFRPNLEVRAICFADPHHPPEGCSNATLRRLAELTGAIVPNSRW